MASLKEIRTKIGSVKNTQKITKAMEMVAASKMRRSQERINATRPYAERIRRVIGHLNQASRFSGRNRTAPGPRGETAQRLTPAFFRLKIALQQQLALLV